MELALLTIFKNNPQAQVTIFGALGGRIDHMLANVFLPSNPKLAPYMRQIEIEDGQKFDCLLSRRNQSARTPFRLRLSSFYAGSG